jgi:hypothetical protein
MMSREHFFRGDTLWVPVATHQLSWLKIKEYKKMSENLPYVLSYNFLSKYGKKNCGGFLGGMFCVCLFVCFFFFLN